GTEPESHRRPRQLPRRAGGGPSQTCRTKAAPPRQGQGTPPKRSGGGGTPAWSPRGTRQAGISRGSASPASTKPTRGAGAASPSAAETPSATAHPNQDANAGSTPKPAGKRSCGANTPGSWHGTAPSSCAVCGSPETSSKERPAGGPPTSGWSKSSSTKNAPDA